MFLQCLKCRYCGSHVPDNQLRFLSVGKRNAPLLILDSTPSNMSLADSTSSAIELSLGDGSDEATVSAIGMFVLSARHPTYAKRLYGLADPGEFELSWAVRCETGEINAEMVEACTMYTRYLYADRKIIVATQPAYEQLELNLPDFVEGKLYKSPLGVILTIRSIWEWLDDDVAKYKLLLNRAKREVDL